MLLDYAAQETRKTGARWAKWAVGPKFACLAKANNRDHLQSRESEVGRKPSEVGWTYASTFAFFFFEKIGAFGSRVRVMRSRGLLRAI
jgi:hypothetical protein